MFLLTKNFQVQSTNYAARPSPGLFHDLGKALTASKAYFVSIWTAISLLAADFNFFPETKLAKEKSGRCPLLGVDWQPEFFCNKSPNVVNVVVVVTSWMWSWVVLIIMTQKKIGMPFWTPYCWWFRNPGNQLTCKISHHLRRVSYLSGGDRRMSEPSTRFLILVG